MAFGNFGKQPGDAGVDPLRQNLTQNIRFGDGAIDVGNYYLLVVVPQENLHLYVFRHAHADIKSEAGDILAILKAHFANLVRVRILAVLYHMAGLTFITLVVMRFVLAFFEFANVKFGNIWP